MASLELTSIAKKYGAIATHMAKPFTDRTRPKWWVAEWWGWFRASLTNTSADDQTALTVITYLAKEADPVISFRPIRVGLLREECSNASGVNDRYIVGRPRVLRWPIEAYWAVTPYQYVDGPSVHANDAAVGVPISGDPVSGDRWAEVYSTTGAVERGVTPFSLRMDAPIAGCQSIENRMFVPCHRRGVSATKG